MVITGVVRGPNETFVVDHAVTAIGADRQALLSEDEEQFRRRAREVLTQAHPGHSAGFADYVCQIAWSRRHDRTARLELTAPTLVWAQELVAGLPDDGPMVAELRAALADAAQRLGVTDNVGTADPD